ncbi:MAG TPA: alpha/beta hydrolase [Galbitalea sp.]
MFNIALGIYAQGIVTTAVSGRPWCFSGIDFREMMTTRVRDPEYAPSPLTSDASRFQLVQSSVSSSFGTIVARSRRTGRSRRATVFLHGAAGSWTTWTPLLDAAEAASISIANPVLLDLPGWGDGILTAEGEDHPIDAICSLVRASVEALGYTEWDLVGHSMGGFLALHMAAIWPECVLSVATVSATSWSVIDATQHPVRHFWRLPGFVLLWRVMQALSHLGPFGANTARGLDAIHVLRALVSPLFRHPGRIPRSVIAALGREVRPRSFAAAVRLARGYDASARWRVIDCPVRAVQGDRDVFSRVSDLERLGDVLPGSHRETLADCGHFANIERPRDVLVAFGYSTGASRKR